MQPSPSNPLASLKMNNSFSNLFNDPYALMSQAAPCAFRVDIGIAQTAVSGSDENVIGPQSLFCGLLFESLTSRIPVERRQTMHSGHL